MEKTDKLTTPWSDLLLSLIEANRDQPSRLNKTSTEQKLSSITDLSEVSVSANENSSSKPRDTSTESVDLQLLKPEAFSCGLSVLSPPSVNEVPCAVRTTLSYPRTPVRVTPSYRSVQYRDIAPHLGGLHMTPPCKQTKQRPRSLKLRRSCSSRIICGHPPALREIPQNTQSSRQIGEIANNAPDVSSYIKRAPVPGILKQLRFNKSPESSPESELTSVSLEADLCQSPVSSSGESNSQSKFAEISTEHTTDNDHNSNSSHIDTVTVNKFTTECLDVELERKLQDVMNYAIGFVEDDILKASDDDSDTDEPDPGSLDEAVQLLMKYLDRDVGKEDKHFEVLAESSDDSVQTEVGKLIECSHSVIPQRHGDEVISSGSVGTVEQTESTDELRTDFDSLHLSGTSSSRRRRKVNDDEVVSRVGCIFQEFDLNYDLTPRCTKNLNDNDVMFGAVELTTSEIFGDIRHLVVLQLATHLYKVTSGYLQYDVPVF